MKKRLTRLEMAEQLREEAAELIRLAMELEGSHSVIEQQVTEHVGKQGGLTVDDIANFMDGKMRRKQALSLEMNVPIEQLDELMTRANGFVMTERGWWKHIDSTSGT